MPLVDVHCHLNHASFAKDQLDVIERARKAGVAHIILAGVNPATNREVIALAKQHDIIECSVGAYPFDALNDYPTKPDEEGLSRTQVWDLDEEIAWWKQHQDEFLAVGEIGMDFSYAKEKAAQQKINFLKCINAAIEMNKAIVVHTRKAEAECIDTILESGIDTKRVDLHCFTGNKKLVKKASDAGITFSIPPVITRLEQFKLLVEIVPLTQLLTETDAPYLGPHPGQRNEPAYIKRTTEVIAKIKGVSEQEVEDQIYKNFERVF